DDRTAFEAAARRGIERNKGQTAGTPRVSPSPSVVQAEATPPALPGGAHPTLPTGTVTFLFTDIAGSTRLLQQLGASRYAAMRDDHHRLLRAAAAAHGGREVDTQGNSFFLAFSTAHDALTAAAQTQQAFAAHPWPDGTPVLVRMGLHTGTPLVTGEGYVG